MFGKQLVTDMINRSAENETDRRVFLKAAGVGGLGAVGATAIGAIGSSASAETPTQAATDGAVLNFALNLEYLEAEFYLNAVYGTGLTSKDSGGKGKTGAVSGGGRAVPFTPGSLAQRYAIEIAQDELKHVQFLRKALGSAKVSRPAINIGTAFAAAASAAGLGDGFDVYASEANFLLGAFIFEDVGVTAYKGAAPLITNKGYLEAAAGILSVEAYHAGIIRTTLYAQGQYAAVQAISDARDSLDGGRNYDQGIGTAAKANLVPTNKNSIVYGRSAAQVLNIVYLNPKSVSKGGFLPSGTNGLITKSGGK